MFFSPLKRRFFRRTACALLGLAIASLFGLTWYTPTTAAVSQAKITQILDGSQVFIQNKKATVNDVAKAKQQIRTGNARAQLQFNTGVIGRLSANSQMVVAGQCFNIRQGTILVNGRLDGCTQSRRLSVRGTTYLVEITEDGGTHVIVFEGEVAVSPTAEVDASQTDFFDTVEPTAPTDADNENQLDENTSTEVVDPEAVTPDTRLETKSLKGYRFPRPPVSPTPPVDDPNSNPESTETTSSEADSSELDPSETEAAPAAETAPEAPAENPPDTVILKPGEGIVISRQGLLSQVAKLSQSEFEGFLKGALFNDFEGELPGLQKIRQSFKHLFPRARFPEPRIPRPQIPGPRIPRLF